MQKRRLLIGSVIGALVITSFVPGLVMAAAPARDSLAFWITPGVTRVRTSTPTDTPESTPTDTPTSTPTNTPTDTPTNTPTNTPTDTPTDTPTNTPTNTPTDTPTNTPTNTPTDTPTNTPTATDTPAAFEGCTPGYWKQPQHFDSWEGFAPGDSFESVFGRAIPGNPTLLEALGTRGGGLSALLRHAAAALLNASSSAVDPVPAFDTTAEVILAFQAAFDSQDYEPTKDLLDASNNNGCPLN
jgi:hypothetical protein